MAKRAFFLLSLLCGDAAAFVVPSARRAVIGACGRDSSASALAAASSSTSRGAARRTSARAATLDMRYIAMNRFKVKLGSEDEFETMWRERESSLASFSGFEQFMLLKVDDGETQEGEEPKANKAGYTEFISHTTWAHQMDFEEWKKSQAFKKAHKAGNEDGKPGFAAVAGGMSKMGDLIVERPSPTLFNAVIMEPTPPEHQGGLWDFEEEPSYFDGDM